MTLWGENYGGRVDSVDTSEECYLLNDDGYSGGLELMNSFQDTAKSYINGIVR